MIKIEGLVKSYADTPVLKGINLHIEEGRIYGIAGRSGTGKSTLLRCINGLEPYQGGSLTVDGVEVRSLSDKNIRLFRKEIGMVFQNFSLLNRLSVSENIALPMKCWHYKPTDIEKKINELLEVVGIPEKKTCKARELSGGQKQRVAIARALALSPRILLCDEATSALDPKSTESILSLLAEINRHLGITIVIVTHEMAVLRSICHNVSILEAGLVEASGTVERIFMDKPQALKNLLGDKDCRLPAHGRNLEILFSNENTGLPIITQMARGTHTDFSIVGGNLEGFMANTPGSIIINVQLADFNRICSYLNDHHVLWRELDNRPELEENAS